MSTEAVVAIIIAAFALIGTIITSRRSVGKTEFDMLNSLYKDLKERFEILEAENHDLKEWADRLCCQIKDAGLKPVEFIQYQRNKKEAK